jgi:hypothetical protein
LAGKLAAALRRLNPSRNRKQMLHQPIKYLKQLRSLQRINIALTKAAATAPLRLIDPTNPASWEFSGFSQHGEDGIIDYLARRLKTSNRYFVEIGAANGLENNSSWLALARMYAGLMIDGDPEESAWCRYLVVPMNCGVEVKHLFLTRESAREVEALSLHKNPDMFSLDIDGNDYFIAEALLQSAMRPKIWVVEYNSAFGPERSLSIPYREDFRLKQEYKLSLYCGCSITAWKKLMARHNYEFVTVDSNGVNAFFIDPGEFDLDFVRGLRGIRFKENFSHAREYKTNWSGQFELIKDFEFAEIRE